MRTPARPPLDGLKKRLDRSRAERELKPRDGFLRETFVLPRTDARDKAKEWFDRWPKQAYWTEIESWFERPGDVSSSRSGGCPRRTERGPRIALPVASLPVPCLASRLGIAQRAFVDRHAAAANAVGQPVAQLLQLFDAPVEIVAPAA